jgi:hypothetical protein
LDDLLESGPGTSDASSDNKDPASDIDNLKDKDDDWVPKVQDRFDGVDDAEDQIRAWAHRIGFEVKIDQSSYAGLCRYLQG